MLLYIFKLPQEDMHFLVWLELWWTNLKRTKEILFYLNKYMYFHNTSTLHFLVSEKMSFRRECHLSFRETVLFCFFFKNRLRPKKRNMTRHERRDGFKSNYFWVTVMISVRFRLVKACFVFVFFVFILLQMQVSFFPPEGVLMILCILLPKRSFQPTRQCWSQYRWRWRNWKRDKK